MNNTLRTLISPLIRHGLTLLSGWLAARGLPGITEATASNVTELAVAGIAAGLAIGWSLLDKRNAPRP